MTRLLHNIPWHPLSPSLWVCGAFTKPVWAAYDGRAWRLSIGGDEWGPRQFKSFSEAAGVVAQAIENARAQA